MPKGNVKITADNNYIQKSMEIIAQHLKLHTLGKNIHIVSNEKNLFNEQEIQQLLQKNADINIILCSKKNCNLISDLDIDGHINTIDISLPIKKIIHKMDISCNRHKRKNIKKNTYGLTSMEKKVVSCYAAQQSITLISRMERLSEKSISAHKRNAMRKMNVTTNQELIIKFNLHRQSSQAKNWIFQ